MTQFWNIFIDFIGGIIDLLDTTVFEFFGVNVSLWSIFVSALIICFVANIWWKGAKG